MKYLNNFYKKAFSIMESIVALMIVSFSVSGIYTAYGSIVFKHKISILSSELFLIRSSVNSFKNVFKHLPGDFHLAKIQIADRPDVLNGNGDGFIDNEIVLNNANSSESYQAWVHLEKVGILPSNSSGFTGKMNSLAIPTFVGINIPASRAIKDKAIGYNLRKYSSVYLDNQKNAIFLEDFSLINNPSAVIGTPSLDLKTMKALDVKIDTGLPTLGSLFAEGETCVDENRKYQDHSDRIKRCKPVFIIE